MNVAMLLEMAADGAPGRVALGSRTSGGGRTYQDLLASARRAATVIRASGAANVAMLDCNSAAVPIAVFGAALAGRPFSPLNYRLAPAQLSLALARLAPAMVVTGSDMSVPDGIAGIEIVERRRFLDAEAVAEPADADAGGDGEGPAVLLFTSGTTGEPKAAVLRHRHLLSYILQTVEFLGADDQEATLVSVPPYHIAGISSVLSSVYAGRRMVQMEVFEPTGWVDLAREEAVTHAMVVPTMLGRILDVLESRGITLPALRHLSYGGGRMPLPTIERALALLPDVSFVNAYGLTETSSTIAVLTPEDHRRAAASDDRRVRRRLGSVGRPLPTLEVEIRGPDGARVPAGEMGEIHVNGDQVAGEYLNGGASYSDGWFPTRDQGWFDADGYLYVEGRLDDVIVRGGENLSPGEIESVLLAHHAVAEAAVVGIPSLDWGEEVAAAIVLHPDTPVSASELQDWVRVKLRSSRTPTRICFVDALPYNELGKLVRRELRIQLTGS